MHAYVVVWLSTGARTEELRALKWDRLDLEGDPPSIEVSRSVRPGGETKTPRSRRTLELLDRARDALRTHRQLQREALLEAGPRWADQGLVFCASRSTELDAANVRRSSRAVARAAGLDFETWTPRELRHSFVSLLSNLGMPIEDIAHLVGHANTRTTEKVYRKELRLVLTKGARTMDAIFEDDVG